ncbi:DUF4149 domain-containing protein [Polynucleobacter sp. JS-Polo-80-F4]|uniref:DUF4149 domain-containing protein n=1 Tax=Polynucleobacter sp. JS-Polo-80-F4 TaxID=2576918 RepID=UPI001C0CA9C6|nr:DUF4149 domain-containing protein [Polynucleobacter sp. JS-Polo-80-F4]MBU3616015.1 hypothetical protein [Polynucleobacter sp. JS-Polo-80-F4]
MVEPIRLQHPLTHRLLRFLACMLAGGIISQAIACIAAYLFINDSQAAGMVAHIVVQQLSYYFLGCAFAILSIANILIKRDASSLKKIRLPLLILMIAVAVVSFLLIPRMDYLRETALIDGMPVMLSPFANYFQVLNILVILLLLTQIISSALVAWRLIDSESS